MFNEDQAKSLIETAGCNWEAFKRFMVGQGMPLVNGVDHYYRRDVYNFLQQNDFPSHGDRKLNNAAREIRGAIINQLIDAGIMERDALSVAKDMMVEMTKSLNRPI